jgi:hypothetical protein
MAKRRTQGQIGSDCSCFVLRGAEDEVSGVAPPEANTLVSGDFAADGSGEVLIHAADQWGPFAVSTQLLEAEPDVPEADWEDVVELSLTTTGPTGVTDLEDNTPWLDLTTAPGSYRVRVLARGRRASDGPASRGASSRETYLIQAWPAPPSEFAVLRLTSSFAEAELNPPPVPVVAGAEQALEAAARIGWDVDGRSGARVLSGERGEVTVERTIRGTRRRLFERCSHLVTWTHVWADYPSWGFIGGGGDDMDYAYAPEDCCDRLPGSGTIRTRFLEVVSPARAVRTFEWCVPDGQEQAAWQQMPFLATPTLMTVTLVQSRDEEKSPWTTITIRHEELPVEWCEDMQTYWAYQLAIADVFEFGTRG